MPARSRVLASATFGASVVGVVPHLGREVEGARQAGLPRSEKEFESLIRRFGRAEAGVLTHRPQAAAVHRRMHTTGVWEFAGFSERVVVREVPEIVRAVHGLDLDT